MSNIHKVSELTIRDIKDTIDMMCPVQVLVNGDIVWDDDTDDLAKYDAIFTSNSIVLELSFEIVHFHHSIVTIITED